MERGQSKKAVSKLDALISTAERLYRHGKITQETKDGLVQCANGIKAQI